MPDQHEITDHSAEEKGSRQRWEPPVLINLEIEKGTSGKKFAGPESGTTTGS
jgi:hypothetical protein